MAFPTPQQEFPPRVWAPAFAQYRRNEAWQLGDQALLQQVYDNGTAGTARTGLDGAHYNKADSRYYRGGVRGFLTRMFNGTPLENTEGRSRTRMHIPIASNIADLSASMLLGAQGARFRAIDRTNGRVARGPLQDRIDEILNGERSRMVLLEGAEAAAGLSAVAVTAHWDRATSDAPWMQITPCDAVIPEFAGETLTAVMLYTRHTTIDQRGTVAGEYIHVERHERGRIVHGLLRMDGDTVSAIVPLGSIDEAAGLSLGAIAAVPGSIAGEVEGTVVLPTGIDRLTATWWKNRATAIHRRGAHPLHLIGRADLEGPAELLLDAADEAWTSWMRDIRVARARLQIPAAYAENGVLGPEFDDAAELLMKLNITNLGAPNETIQAHQFAIRAADHEATVLALTREITDAAGWSLSSYGSRGEGNAITATEVVDRSSLSERTRQRKFLHFAHALVPLAEALLDLDAEHYRGRALGADQRLDVTIPARSTIDPAAQAQSMSLLRAAQVLSIETAVRERNPDWDDDEVDAEVRRLREEFGTGEEVDAGAEDREDPNYDPDAPADPAALEQQQREVLALEAAEARA